MTVEDELISLHEAGHALLAHRLGWSPRMTVVGGSGADGCTPIDAPARPVGGWMGSEIHEWPEEPRRWHENQCMVRLGGDLAEVLVSPPRVPRVRRRGPSVAEEAAAITETLPPPTEAEQAQMTAVTTGDPMLSDAEVIAWLAAQAHVDMHCRVSWIGYLAACTAAVIAEHAFAIRRLAAEVRAARTLGSEAVALVLGPRDPA